MLTCWKMEWVGITSFSKFLHKACWILLFVSFSYRIRQGFCSSTIRFAPCAFFINKQFRTCANFSRMSSLSGRMNIARVNIGFFTGLKKIKQRRISFVLGYLSMILWKISTAISIKHRILATFNIKKKFNSDSLYSKNGCWYGKKNWNKHLLPLN